MHSPSVTPGSLRWAGILMMACGLLAAGHLVFTIGESSAPQLDAISLTIAAVGAVMVAALGLPWQRWVHSRALWLAVGALFLLPLVDLSSDYGASGQAAATYPLFVTLVLAWVGLTQPRRTALFFTFCVGAVLAAVVLSQARSSIPLASLAVVLPAGAALGEAAAWIMSELRQLQRHDERRATTLIDLTRTLDTLPERTSRAEVAGALATTAARLFSSRAEVTVIDPDGVETVTTAGVSRFVPSGQAPLATNSGATLTVALPKRTTITLVGQRGILGRVMLELERDPDNVYLTNLVRLFAAQSSAALERFERLVRLDHEVTHDVLTGTGNRRHANNLFSTLRNGDGVILIDVDAFKNINDTAGHLAGDDLLRTLGEYLNGYVRGSDDVARLGGDEFVVLARGVGHGATTAAARLIEGWRALDPPTTVSIGVAVHRAGDDPQASLERADQALYQAKRAGRNQVGIGPDEVSGDLY